VIAIAQKTPANLEVHTNWHPGQQAAWDSRRRFVFMISGTQGGKTSFGPWWLVREIYGDGEEVEGRGSGDYIGATSSFDLFKLKMLPELRRVFEHKMGVGRYWSGDKVMELRDPSTGKFWAQRADDPMWGRIILRSATAAGGLESATANAAWLDEVGQDEFTLTAWEAVMRRLALSRGRVLGTTTPYSLGWLKQQVYDRWQRGDPDIDVIQFASTMNPVFPAAEFEDRRAKMPDWKFRMFYMGLFERPAGLIYGDFIDKDKDAGGHKVAPFPLPHEWPRYVGVDPGAVHCAKVWLAHDTDADVYYLYRASLEGGKSTSEHAGEAAQLARDNGERVITWFVGAKSEIQQRLDWQAAGVPNVQEPDISDVEAQIDKVIQLWRQYRLFVFDDCLGVLDELATYRRELDSDGEATEKIHNKAQYHHLDALRYAVAGVTRRSFYILPPLTDEERKRIAERRRGA
jgi:hypothetical protein